MSDTQNLIENRPPSVATLFIERVAATPDAEAFRYPVPPASGQGPDEWRSLTWGRTAERVYAISAGLVALGVLPEERVSLASSTRIEWILADFGVMCAGAATTTIYPSTNADESVFILSDSGSRVLIAEDAAQLAKVRAHRAELPDLASGEVLHPREDVVAHVPADRHGRTGTEVDGHDLRRDLEHGDAEHHPADAHHVHGVALDHTVVDDVGVQRGQIERGQRLQELEENDQGDRSPVGPEMGA